MQQKGYEYPGWPLYHATGAYTEVLEHGLLSRAELARRAGGDEVHFTGGGTAHAISMTLDPRVAEAIVIGIHTISQLVRGEMSLGELMAAAAIQAPSGAADAMKEYHLTPERIARYDEGLKPWYTRMLTGSGISIAKAPELGVEVVSAFEPQPDRHYGTEVDHVPEGSMDVKGYFGLYASDLDDPDKSYVQAMSLSGWAPKMQVCAAYRHGDEAAFANNAHFVGIYKRLLAMSSFDAEEVYDPLFFLTSLDAMRDVDPEELWVVRARCDAPWICMGGGDARRLIPGQVDQWGTWMDSGRACEDRLDSIARDRDYLTKVPGDRSWGQPEPEDTVVYLGRAMAEVRVYDSSLLSDLAGYANVDDIEEDLRDRFPERYPEDLPIVAYPWFRARGN